MSRTAKKDRKHLIKLAVVALSRKRRAGQR